jgi:hypothetical protein
MASMFRLPARKTCRAGKAEPDSYIPIVSSQRIEVKLLVEVDSLRSRLDDSVGRVIYM